MEVMKGELTWAILSRRKQDFSEKLNPLKSHCILYQKQKEQQKDFCKLWELSLFTIKIT